MSFQDENEGDNKEFAVADISDVTIHIGLSGFTSENDTATDKYFDNRMSPIPSARLIFIRNDETIQLVSMNAVIFTDPVTIIVDKGHKETFGAPIINKFVLRTTVANTAIKIRFK